MIVIDASALLAVYLGESDRDGLIAKLKKAEGAVMSPVGLWEAFVRAVAVNGPGATTELEALLANFAIQVAPADGETARIAADAFARYGRRTPAALNLGDCFAYALAKQRDAALLYKGDDFSKTDIEAA